MHPKRLVAALHAGAVTNGEHAAIVLVEHYRAGALLRCKQITERVTDDGATARLDWPKVGADLDPASGKFDGLPPGGRAALGLAVALATNGRVDDFADTLALVDSTVLRAIAYAVTDEPPAPALSPPSPDAPLYTETLRDHATAAA